MFRNAYSAYETYAFPADELEPIVGDGSNSLNGWGLTTIDSMDTMLLMDLKEEYERALTHVKSLKMEQTTTPIRFFETVIRYLGGLLGAYTLTGDPLLLEKADDLGDILMPAFHDSESGLPQFFVIPSTQKTEKGPQGRKAALSETASFTLEFNTLAKLTGRREYAELVHRLIEILEANHMANGLWPISWDIDTLEHVNHHLAVGGNADSAYEYLLKLWLSDSSSRASRQLYINAANGIINTLLYLSPKRHMLYATDIPNVSTGIQSQKFEHLTCFLPGLLALGVNTLHENLSLRERRMHMWAAEGLGQTCWLLYADHRTTTGLAADEVVFSRWPRPKGKNGKPLTREEEMLAEAKQGLWVDAVHEWERVSGSKWRKGGVWGHHEEADRIPPGVRTIQPVETADERDYWLRRAENLLRPEFVESMYILWKTTHNALWRERGWEVCEAFERSSRTPSLSYSGIRRVDHWPVQWMDNMPSWFLSESLKYCYLLASDKDLVPFDRYVFNTEGHVLPRFEWDGWKHKFKKIWQFD